MDMRECLEALNLSSRGLQAIYVTAQEGASHTDFELMEAIEKVVAARIRKAVKALNIEQGTVRVTSDYNVIRVYVKDTTSTVFTQVREICREWKVVELELHIQGVK